MALPKLNTPTYELELPSTAEILKYRPFLVKEQKLLLIAQESGEDSQITTAMGELVKTCTFNKIDPKIAPMFDIEYVFLKIRGKSVGDIVELNLLCPDDGETRVKTSLNLEDVGVNQKLGHTNEINITDKIKIIMNYPTLNDMVGMVGEKEAGFDEVLEMMKRCIHEVHDGETVHSKIDMSESDLNEFIESLTTEQFQGLADFFDTMPKIAHSIEVTNPKTKKKGEVVIEGIQSFFD